MSSQNNLVHAAFESFPRSMILTDVEGKIEYLNKKAKSLLGIKRNSYLGKGLHQLVHSSKSDKSDHGSKKCRLLQSLIEKKVQSNVSDKFYTSGGDLIEIEYSLYPLAWGKKKIGFLIRFRKEPLGERREKQFIASLGHELKTPLTIIKSYNHLIKKFFKEQPNEKAKKYVSIIDDKVSFLAQLIEGMMDTIKLGAGKLSFSDQEINLDQELVEIISQMQRTIASHHLSLSGKTNAIIDMDRKRLFQIISNLINNAVKYSSDADRVDISSSQEGNFVLIQIKDYGLGIKKEDALQIFKPFFRSKQSRNKKPGLGMGLFLIKQIVDHYQGEIWFSTQQDRGVTFFVQLPVSKETTSSL